jgi:hypothetical protein
MVSNERFLVMVFRNWNLMVFFLIPMGISLPARCCQDSRAVSAEPTADLEARAEVARAEASQHARPAYLATYVEPKKEITREEKIEVSQPAMRSDPVVLVEVKKDEVKAETKTRDSKAYTFAGSLSPKYADDMIIFVKRLSEHLLVVLDRKGLGEIIELVDGAIRSTITFEMSVADAHSVRDFFYLPESNIVVAASRSDLYSSAKLEPHSTYIELRKIDKGYPLKVYQLSNKSPHPFIVLNRSTGRMTKIEITQEGDINDCGFVDEPVAEDLGALEYGPLAVCDELLNRPRDELNRNSFDLDSVTDRELIGTTPSLWSIYSHHHYIDGTLYCGHDGKVSFWRHNITTPLEK